MEGTQQQDGLHKGIPGGARWTADLIRKTVVYLKNLFILPAALAGCAVMICIMLAWIISVCIMQYLLLVTVALLRECLEIGEGDGMDARSRNAEAEKKFMEELLSKAPQPQQQNAAMEDTVVHEHEQNDRSSEDHVEIAEQDVGHEGEAHEFVHTKQQEAALEYEGAWEYEGALEHGPASEEAEVPQPDHKPLAAKPEQAETSHEACENSMPTRLEELPPLVNDVAKRAGPVAYKKTRVADRPKGALLKAEIKANE